MTEMSNPPVQDGPDLNRLAQAASEALTDNMVERLTTATGNVMEVADRLNDPDTREAVVALLDGLTDLHKAGALDTAIQTIMTIHALRSAATDQMVDRAFGFVEHMVNNLGTEEIATLAHETKLAMEEAVEECVQPTGGGILGMMKMLRQPEAQSALRFLLAFGCKLQQRAQVLSKTPSLPGESG